MAERGFEYVQSRRKRTFDVIGSSMVMGAFAPIELGVAVGSAIDTRYPNPIFTQDRVGSYGKRFKALKFRSLPREVENEPVKTFGAFDPRASKFGQFLRQVGLDEMPQLANVLKGDMSLVGPRPLIQADIDKMEQADRKLFGFWIAAYEVAKPGLLGASQILRHHYLNGLTPELYRKSMALDVDYMERASLRTDLKILACSPIDIVRTNMGVVDNTDEEFVVEELEEIVLQASE